MIDNTKIDLNAASLGAIRPAATPQLRFSDHPGWSDEQLARFNAYRDQGDLFRETPPTLLDPPPLLVQLEYQCNERDCAGHIQRIIDWELTALQLRYRHKSTAELKSAITRNFIDLPFSGERQPLIFVGNQENVQRRASFTVLGLYYPRRSDIEQSGLLF
ncbi:hypothetical protein [Jatrophihabitans sp.]|uniref:hypothetical protein n=1 Tax=Jatrophihabitans sp. TaxID=1932789 RepID=UPI002F1F430F